MAQYLCLRKNCFNGKLYKTGERPYFGDKLNVPDHFEKINDRQSPEDVKKEPDRTDIEVDSMVEFSQAGHKKIGKVKKIGKKDIIVDDGGTDVKVAVKEAKPVKI